MDHVEDVVERNADGDGESYIGVNLGLFVRHTKAGLMCCRQLIEQKEGGQS